MPLGHPRPRPQEPLRLHPRPRRPHPLPRRPRRGRYVARDPTTHAALARAGQIPLRYTTLHGEPPGYPDNPNGSHDAVAALCNPRGNVMGLMPHPEDHIHPAQHPRRHRGERGRDGLRLFAAGIRHAASL